MTQEDARYQRNPDFIFRKIVDEMVLVPIHQDVADMDCLYTLNGVGASIWARLEKPATPAELRAGLLEEYDVDPEVLAADLDKFITEMAAVGAVREI